MFPLPASMSAFFFSLLVMIGINSHSDAPNIKMKPNVTNILQKFFLLSNQKPQMGGPTNCNIPFTNKLIPYVDIKRSTPKNSAIINVVTLLLIPDAKPKNAQNTLIQRYESRNGITTSTIPENSSPPTK